MKKRSENRSKFSYTSLEGRRLLAGNVTVVENVHLYVRGDGADNQLEIVVDGDQLKINGVDGTTINGQDSFVVAGAEVTESGVVFAGGLRAHLGPGHDDLSIVDAHFESLTIVFGGTGNDDIEVTNSVFGDKAVIQTYQGDDSIEIARSQFFGDLFAITLAGKDDVSMTASTTHANSYVVTGQHNDSVTSIGSRYMGDSSLVLSLDGNDSVHISDPVVMNMLGIFLGRGDDRIDADLLGATMTGQMRVGGQAGVDRGEMEMHEATEASVSLGTLEAVGESVYQSTDGDVFDSVYSYLAVPNNALQAPAQRLEFAETTQVYYLDFAGSYERNYANDSDADGYTIQILGNEFEIDPFLGQVTKPSSDVLYEVTLPVAELNQVSTGTSYQERGQEIEIFQMTAEIDFEFQAGKKYWITVYQNLSMGPDSQGDFRNDVNGFLWARAWRTGNAAESTYGAYQYANTGWLGSAVEGGDSTLGYLFDLRA